MHALAVTVGSHRYLLAPGTKRRRLEARIVSAMRRGAGVVRLRLQGGGVVDVVVTPAVPVIVERLPAVTADLHGSGERAIDWPAFTLGRD